MEVARRKLLQLSAGALASALVLSVTNGAGSQTTRTIKIIVPYAPGGGGSVLARVFADQIEQQRVATVVENRPGAATVIGTEAVARAAPDGNTLLITNTPFVTNPHFRKQNYDPFTSFEPVCSIAQVPTFIAVSAASPYRTLAEFLAAARAKPGELTMAAFVGSVTHIGLEMLNRAAKADITFVPFPGSAPAVTALLGGHVTAIYDNYAAVAEHVNAGKLRVLATGSRTRLDVFPNIPTIAEAGYPDYDVESWWAVFAPATTPKNTVAQLADWFAAASRAPETAAKLTPLGFYPRSVCGTEFSVLVRKTYDDLGRAIREANIKAE
jgi:tripartite-type tricarboxylate transporter receptor subunit TctC